MEKVVHTAEKRGKGDYGWLKTNYSFSFADWYDPTRMGFGALRVINDDVIAPANGFGAHSHRDMEIITIVMNGTVTHKDSLGNTGTVPAGDVQVMSAGRGVTHSEYNDSPREPLELFQIWIESRDRGIEPYYNQRSFNFLNKEKGVTCLVDSDGENGLMIHQDAYVHYASLTQNEAYTYRMKDSSNGVYILVVEGSAIIENEILRKRDAIGVTHTDAVLITPVSDTKLLLIEVPV